MKKIVQLSLLALCLPMAMMAQSNDDDLYYNPKTDQKEVKQSTQVPAKKVKQQVTTIYTAPNTTTTVVVKDKKGNVRDVDEYNRRYTSKENDFSYDDGTLYVEEKQTPELEGEWVNGFEGSDDDYEYAERIIRFRNPRYAVHISSPYYWDIVYGGNSFDWNVYTDGWYAYAFPTFSNRLWWDWRFGSFGLGWNSRWYGGWNSPYYYGGYYGGYYDPWYGGWGGYYGHHGYYGYYGHHHYSHYYPYYSHSGRPYRGGTYVNDRYSSSYGTRRESTYSTRRGSDSNSSYRDNYNGSTRRSYIDNSNQSTRRGGRVVSTRGENTTTSTGSSIRGDYNSSNSVRGDYNGTSTRRGTYTRPSETRTNGSFEYTRPSSTRSSSSAEGSTRRGTYTRGSSSDVNRSSTRSYEPSTRSSSRSYESGGSTSRGSYSSGGSTSRGSYSGGGSSSRSGGGSSTRR